jgi:ABC-2 type transport system permease protein
MNTRAVRAIIHKDLRVVSQNKGVTIPLVAVPIILYVALPAVAAFIPALQGATGASDFTTFLQGMPAGLKSSIAGYDPDQQMIIAVVVYLMAPMFLIVPLMVASVIAADSFAGEKERKTLEALIYTPTTDQELFLAKVLSAWLPALGVSLGGFVLYGLVANAAAWPTMGRVFFPNGMWLVLVFWVAPAVAGLGLAVTVLVSARAQGFQDAYQMGAIVVLPLLVLIVGQAMGVMYFSIGLVFLLGLGFWVVTAGLIWLGGRTFQRSEMIARL